MLWFHHSKINAITCSDGIFFQVWQTWRAFRIQFLSPRSGPTVITMNTRDKNATYWHRLDPGQVREQLQSTTGGLDPEEARRRHAQYGPNELVEKNRKIAMDDVRGPVQGFHDPGLVAAAVVAGVIGERRTPSPSPSSSLHNAVLGFVQDTGGKGHGGVEKMAAPSATVVRADRPPLCGQATGAGDLVVLEAGNVVPADMRLVEAIQLRIDEATLTGESVRRKRTAPCCRKRNCLWATAGTWPSRAPWSPSAGAGAGDGHRHGHVLGRIAALLQNQGEGRTPFRNA